MKVYTYGVYIPVNVDELQLLPDAVLFSISAISVDMVVSGGGLLVLHDGGGVQLDGGERGTGWDH